MDKFITVIIPVYNSEGFIVKLLNSIKEQTYDKSTFEVLLIDNNSTDATADIIKDYIKNNRSFAINYYMYNAIQSSYACRNFGVSKANGEILAFTDADCILDQNWLLNIQNHFADDNNINIISGHVKLYISDKSNIFEYYDSTIHMRNDLKQDSKEVATANMAVLKKDMLDVGLFDEVKSGGDFSWSKRANEKGKNIIYCSDVLVNHPSRNGYEQIKKKMLRIAYGNGQLYRLNNKPILLGIIKNILRIFNIPQLFKVYKKMFNYVGLKGIIKLNNAILKIRVLQILEFKRGYRFWLNLNIY